MKTKSFIFLMLTLVGFLSCDPPVPRGKTSDTSCHPEASPPIFTESRSGLPIIDLRTQIDYNFCRANGKHVASTISLWGIAHERIFIPEYYGGKWLLNTIFDKDTVAITTFYYKEPESTIYQFVGEYVTTKYLASTTLSPEDFVGQEYPKD